MKESIRKKLPKALQKPPSSQLLCMIVVFLILFFLCCQKRGTFLDELLTYDLSNRHSPQISFLLSELREATLSSLANDLNDLLEHGREGSRIYQEYQKLKQETPAQPLWRSPEYFATYLETEKGQRFDFLSVLYNSIYNTSPPLYYHLIHLICSFFPGSFSLWYGLLVNLIFMQLSCLLLYRLAKQYCGGTSHAWLITLCYALSIGGMATLMIIRMYALCTFFILSFLSIHLHMAEHDFQMSKKIKTAYILCAVLGFYTQYYFIMYAGLLALVTLFLAGNRKRIFAYIRTALTAAGSSLLLWPFSIKHIFLDSFGANTFQTAASGGFFTRFMAYLEVTAEALFADRLILFFLTAFLLAGGMFFAFLKIRQGVLSVPDRHCQYLIPMLLVPAAGYLVLTALSAPFISDRYIMCLFPLLILGISGGFRYILRCVLMTRKMNRQIFPAMAACGILLTAFSLATVEKNYTYPEQDSRNMLLEEGGDTTFLYVSADNGWQYKSCLDLMARCSQTAIIQPPQITELTMPDQHTMQTLVAINRSFDQQDTLNHIIHHCSLSGHTMTRLPAESDDYALLYLFTRKTPNASEQQSTSAADFVHAVIHRSLMGHLTSLYSDTAKA